jgi:hypothetical protein
MAPIPASTLGRLFSALGRNDTEQIKRWQGAMNADAEAQDTIGIMAEYALAELVAAGPKKFGNRDVARIHHALGQRGFQFGLFEVQRVLDAASGKKVDLSKLTVGQLIKMRIGLFQHITLGYNISESVMDGAIVRAEEKVQETSARAAE